MPRLIWVFAGCTLTLLVLSRGGSSVLTREEQKSNIVSLWQYKNILFSHHKLIGQHSIPHIKCICQQYFCYFQKTLKIKLTPYGENFYYRKKPKKNSATRKHHRNYPKIWLIWTFHRVMCPKDADGIANSADTDQSDLGLHCLLSPVCQKNLGSLRYLF